MTWHQCFAPQSLQIRHQHTLQDGGEGKTGGFRVYPTREPSEHWPGIGEQTVGGVSRIYRAP